MKRNFLFSHMKEHKKLERLPFTDPSYLIQLQSFEDTKIKAKSTEMKQGNQLKSIKINQN